MEFAQSSCSNTMWSSVMAAMRKRGQIMTDISRLGLGAMGMSIARNPQDSIDTIHAALDGGVTLLNTGEFYGAGESELVVGKALRGVPQDNYFLSVKFGVLPAPEGGIYGLDVRPQNIKAHLVYSLRRLGLDSIDLYQPARMDTTIPVEDVVGAIAEQVEAGYVRHIGLSMVDAETLRRACAVHPIHTVEMEYSLVERGIEDELIPAAKELGVKVLAYGTVGHGLLRDDVFTASRNPAMAQGMLAGEYREHNLAMIRKVKAIADEKGVSLSQLALAWSLAKYDNVQSLIGTTNPTHLRESIDALDIALDAGDIARIESALDADKVEGKGSRNFVFTDGKMSLAR